MAGRTEWLAIPTFATLTPLRLRKGGIQSSRYRWTPRSVTRTSQRKKGKGPPSSSRCPYPGVLDILPPLVLGYIILS